MPTSLTATAISAAQAPTRNSEERFLSLAEVITRTGLSKSTIYMQIDFDEFPKQVPLGARRVVWLASEINQWIAARIAAARPTSRGAGATM